MKVHDKPLVYLDNAATTQKPQRVLDALNRFYTRECANIHRGLHYLSDQATVDYEHARTRVQRFLGAAESSEIIFVRGTTEAINLVAHSFGRKFVGPGDEIITTVMEHHSNIVPWQMLCEEKGAKLRVVPINDAGELILDEFEKLLNPKTRLVAVAHISNALGTVNPVRRMIEMAHARNIPVLIDGAQAVAHTKIDVQELDCDFYCFSGHKIYGPTGIGVLYGKAQWLEQIPPYQGGGDMIISVTFEKTTYNCPPHKFEAGTPHIAGGIGLGAAIEYIDNLGLDHVAAHEHDLLEYATRRISAIPGVRIIGNAQKKSGTLSFYLEDVHPHDIGTILDRDGVAIRAGHHCAMPVMDRFGIPATARASFACYNTREEVDALVRGVDKVREIFAR
ncbi:MAG: cysteine sulfinate desulfinase [Acidobacteria bacterium RIFCSPLOWO2_12_FULL_54_10]|nr:MAG: cysteine sulfinate desulfinase [Acidobacteria bacterium RIFCSPLOWO2_12_FULL_54_10]